MKQVKQLITEGIVEAKRIRMKPSNGGSTTRDVHLQKPHSGRQTPVLNRVVSSDKFAIGEKTLKSTKNIRVSASSVNLNSIKPRKGLKSNSGHTPNKNLQINIARQGAAGPETIQSKVSSTQSASRNLPKG